MADIYVSHIGGNNSPFGSWSDAATTLQEATNLAVAGDRIFVSSNHVESAAAYSNTWWMLGNAASPIQILSVLDNAEPPTTLAAGAKLTSLSGRVIWNVLNFTRVNGLVLESGGDLITFAGSGPLIENCTFRLNTNGAQIHTNDNAPVNELRWVNCRFNPTFSNQFISSNGGLVWTGGGILPGSAPLTSLLGGGRAPMYLDSLDLSAAAAGLNIATSADSRSFARIINSKLPASWIGDVHSGTIGPGSRFEMFNCDSGNTNYRLRVKDYCGTIRDETSITRTGGARDGVTSISWKLVSNGNVSFASSSLRSVSMAVRNSVIGAQRTATVEILTDGVTLSDKECWLEIGYQSEAGSPLGAIAIDACALLAAGVSQESSVAAWSTTGLTAPVKQKLSVSFTPQQVGFVHAVVHLSRPNTSVYVDPKITVS